MKDELPVVGARISHALNQKLQERCQETGETSSDIVKAALSEYLGVHDADSAKSLAKRVAALERQYKKLAQLV